MTQPDGTAERRAPEAMLGAPRKHVAHRMTVGEEKVYDCADHVARLRELRVAPHVAQNESEQRGTMRRTKHRGLAGVADDFLLNLIGYNLIRLRKLIAT